MASSKKSNVIKFKKPRFSIGTAIFSLLFLYIVFSSFNFLNKEKISIYEVNEKQMSDNNTTVGVAIRKEDIYTSPSTGYISYYNSIGSKVRRGAPIFSVDQTGSINDLLEDIGSDVEMSSADFEPIRSAISTYKNSFDYSDYNQVYDFKYLIESSLLSYISDKNYSKLASVNNSNSFAITNATNSGLVAYWTDSLEGILPETVNKDTFSEDNYSKVTLKTSDSVNEGDPVCKVVTSEDWSIVIKLNDTQYTKLEGKERVKIKFCKDDVEVNVPYRIFVSDGVYYAELYMNNYVSRYIDDRFINIELLLNSAEGLKIPSSSIIEKSCYKIPASFLTKGDESNDLVLTYEVYLENGKTSTENIGTFAYKDEEYVYIDCLLLQPGTTLINPENDERFQIGEMCTLLGVYNVNKGFCQFKHVEVVYENKDYCIVKKNMDYGLAVYDHIVINPDLIGENDIIY